MKNRKTTEKGALYGRLFIWEKVYFLQSESLKINFRVVVAALKQLFHDRGSDLSRVGAGAGIADGKLCNGGKLFKELLLVYYAAFIILDAKRDSKRLVELSETCDKRVGKLGVAVAFKPDKLCDLDSEIARQGSLNYT